MLLCLGATACILLYYNAFRWLLGIWWEQKAYSHGFLVPIISFFLVWIRRKQLAHLPVRPCPLLGGVVLLVSAIFLLAGRAGALSLAEAVSLLIFLPGLVLFLLGRDFLRALALPLAYLQFMVPWLEELISRLYWPFQIVTAKMAVLLLQVFGYPVLRYGPYIRLPGITLEVAPECSGLRYLMTILAIGIPLVYLTQRTWRRAIVVVGIGVAISVLTNGVRAAVIGMIGNRFGGEYAHGPYEVFQGWVVTQVGLVVLIAVNALVSMRPPRQGPRLFERWHARIAEQDTTTPANLTRALMIISPVLLIFAIYLNFFAIPRPVPPRQPLDHFPSIIGGWYGQRSDWLNSADYFPGVDAEVKRSYIDSSGRRVYVYVGYYSYQSQGKSVISYLANALRVDVHPIPTAFGPSGPQVVNVARPVVANKRYLVLSWYRVPSGELTGRYETKLKGITDALLHRHNNAAVILIAAPITETEPAESIQKDLLALARSAAPALNQFLP